MPVRIYDIAKKLGIESKEVLAKAKELGISTARVPSSSLDKITAEYLEDHLRPARPAVVEPIPGPPVQEPIVIVSAPPPAPESETVPPGTSIEAQPPPAVETIAAPAEPSPSPATPTVEVKTSPPAPPEPPPVPAGRASVKSRFYSVASETSAQATRAAP
jgi:translation initiation factor IF-2